MELLIERRCDAGWLVVVSSLPSSNTSGALDWLGNAQAHFTGFIGMSDFIGYMLQIN